ncbi:MAG TPA: hypothetical protein VHW25_19180 [Steroidobacteraceae bacterium]|jgi:hypothetical protein|nr:hypothetical protein [Steroidobacteraceae bacterium]
MNISRQDAAQALASVEIADRRMDTLRAYRDAAPFLQLWGAVWFIANAVTEFWPRQLSAVWLLATVIGSVVTAGIIVLHARRRKRLGLYSAEKGRRIGRGFMMVGITILAYFVSMHLVLGHLDARQSNAFTSLFWAFTYMTAGAWLGARLFLTGAVAVVAIVAGYLYIHEHFALWMAFSAGGSLMLAGFWLRRP